MEKLKKYLSFIKENHLEEVARQNLRDAWEMKIPIMRLLEGLPEEAQIEQSKKGIRDFADQLADGTYVEKRFESMRRWENDDLPELRNLTISPEDLVLIYPLQRKMFYRYLPEYTKDPRLCMEILEELDALHTSSQLEAVKVLVKKQQQAEQRLKFQNYLLDNATDAVLTTDNSFHITYANKACEALFGYTMEELVGKISSEAFRVASSHEKERRERLNSLQSKGNVSGEVVYLSKNDEPVPVLVSASRMTGQHGEPAGYFIVFKDIRERKIHEQQIEKTNAFMNAILENLPIMVFAKEPNDLRFIEFNKAGEDLIGFPREDILGKSDFDFFPKDQAEFFISKDRDVLTNGKLVDIPEEPIQTRNKGLRWLHTKKIPVHGHNGSPGFLLGISEDITDKKIAEKALRDVEQRFRLMVDNVKDYAIFMIDQTGTILSWNKGAERIKGYKSAEAIGKNISIFYTPEDIAENLPAKTLTAARESGSVEVEGLRVRKNGERFIADVIITALYDDDHHLRGFVKITRDVTVQKRQEDEIRGLNKELEAFTYSVSHDLRAPLRAVSGYTNMLREDYGSKFDEEGKRLLEVIRYNAEKMGQLIDDLLSFSRLGRKELEKTSEDLHQLVEGALIEVNKGKPHNAEIRIGKMHTVKVDYGLMHQVLVNLISNAIKYSSKKEKPVVEISSEKKNGEVIICVKDNGVGFNMKYVDKLFGVFQRLHAMDEFEGTGVGLAIVQRIINKHHGRVWAEGKVNEGATFCIALPD